MKGNGLQSRPCHSFTLARYTQDALKQMASDLDNERKNVACVPTPCPFFYSPLALHRNTVSRTCPVRPSLCTFRHSRAWGLAGICRLRDGWLQNLGTEMDNNLLLLR